MDLKLIKLNLHHVGVNLKSMLSLHNVSGNIINGKSIILSMFIQYGEVISTLTWYEFKIYINTI